MKRVFRLLLGTTIMMSCMVLLASCGDEKDAIKFLNFKPEIADVYEEVAKAYKNETGNILEVSTAAAGTYESSLKAVMGTSNAPAIFQINGPVGYESWRYYCADLSNTELYSHLSDKTLAVKSGDGVYGIPYTVEGYGIIYNDKLTTQFLNSDVNKTGFSSMDEINNFEKLKKLVEGMQENKASLGIDGVFAATSLKSGEDWRWQTHTFNISLNKEFGDIQETPSEIEFAYADNYKNIMDLYMNNSTVSKSTLGTFTVDDSMAEFALEKCVMVQNGNWATSQITDVKGIKIEVNDIKFLPIYTGIEGEENQGLCIGTENYLAINSRLSEEKQKEALDFLNWLFTSETGKSFVIGDLGFIAPFDTFNENERPDNPLSSSMIEWMNKDNVTSIPWTFTVMPSQTFKNNLGADLLSYAQGNLSWTNLVSKAIVDWKKEASNPTA